MEVLAADTSGEPIVTFCGAARSVTGSMHLLETGENRILLDCGLFLGSPAEELQRNGHFPFPAHEIDAVILSHAHIDHCGNLPNLVRQGFVGPIYCTPATRDLIELMLVDSAKIQQEEAVVQKVLGKEEAIRGRSYTLSDAAQTVEQCVVMCYEEEREIVKDVRLRFVDAGHLLGSAMIAMTIRWGGGDAIPVGVLRHLRARVRQFGYVDDGNLDSRIFIFSHILGYFKHHA